MSSRDMRRQKSNLSNNAVRFMDAINSRKKRVSQPIGGPLTKRKLISPNKISEKKVKLSSSHIQSDSSKRTYETVEEKWKHLNYLDNEYSKIDTNLQLDRPQLSGICLDMCPEKERYMREFQKIYSEYECDDKKKFDPCRAVKDYERCSADKQEPPPYELRPTDVLYRTMQYLLVHIINVDIKTNETNWKKWYQFLWTRTRSIRKDITQQNLVNVKVVEIFEIITRFHIFCGARLCDAECDVFDFKLNDENLKNCLQSLKDLYREMPPNSCANEPEFRAYMILMKIDELEVTEISEEIIKSPELKLALQIIEAYLTNNYVRFFKLVKSADFILSCLLHRYFVFVRARAFSVIRKVYLPKRNVEINLPLENFSSLLGFDSLLDCEKFCQQINIETLKPEPRFMKLSKTTRHSHANPLNLLKFRSYFLVEQKAVKHNSLSELLLGNKNTSNRLLDYSINAYIKPCRMWSFDNNNIYIGKDEKPIIKFTISPKKSKTISKEEICLSDGEILDDDDDFTDSIKKNSKVTFPEPEIVCLDSDDNVDQFIDLDDIDDCYVEKVDKYKKPASKLSTVPTDKVGKLDKYEKPASKLSTVPTDSVDKPTFSIFGNYNNSNQVSIFGNKSVETGSSIFSGGDNTKSTGNLFGTKTSKASDLPIVSNEPDKKDKPKINSIFSGRENTKSTGNLFGTKTCKASDLPIASNESDKKDKPKIIKEIPVIPYSNEADKKDEPKIIKEIPVIPYSNEADKKDEPKIIRDIPVIHYSNEPDKKDEPKIIKEIPNLTHTPPEEKPPKFSETELNLINVDIFNDLLKEIIPVSIKSIYHDIAQEQAALKNAIQQEIYVDLIREVVLKVYEETEREITLQMANNMSSELIQEIQMNFLSEMFLEFDLKLELKRKRNELLKNHMMKKYFNKLLKHKNESKVKRQSWMKMSSKWQYLSDDHFKEYHRFRGQVPKITFDSIANNNSSINPVAPKQLALSYGNEPTVTNDIVEFNVVMFIVHYISNNFLKIVRLNDEENRLFYLEPPPDYLINYYNTLIDQVMDNLTKNTPTYEGIDLMDLKLPLFNDQLRNREKDSILYLVAKSWDLTKDQQMEIKQNVEDNWISIKDPHMITGHEVYFPWTKIAAMAVENIVNELFDSENQQTFETYRHFQWKVDNSSFINELKQYTTISRFDSSIIDHLKTPNEDKVEKENIAASIHIKQEPRKPRVMLFEEYIKKANELADSVSELKESFSKL